MQSRAISLPIDEGPVTRFELRGRCRRCWGPTRGRTDAERRVTGIKCLVCNMLLEGEEAYEEDERAFKEATLNALNMNFGHLPKYGAGPFAIKVYPPRKSITEDKLLKRVSLAKKRHPKPPRKLLTRQDFPPGSPGWLFLQAKVLIEGVGYFDDVDGGIVTGMPDYSFRSDGSVTVPIPAGELSVDPHHHEHQLMRTMGSLMGASMVSAFACELLLKAIAIATKDEAKKIHDLLLLFEDLPERSMARVTADYSDSRAVLEQCRGTFGAWRYIESSIGKESLSAIVKAERARQLTKTARVLLDEAMYVGLYGRVRLDAKRKTTDRNARVSNEDVVDITWTGGERPQEP